MVCEDLLQNTMVEVPYEICINALASQKNKIDLKNVKANVAYIGDCLEGAGCNIDTATKTAYDVANQIGM